MNVVEDSFGVMRLKWLCVYLCSYTEMVMYVLTHVVVLFQKLYHLKDEKVTYVSALTGKYMKGIMERKDWIVNNI
jgi:hypothetical protein